MNPGFLFGVPTRIPLSHPVRFHVLNWKFFNSKFHPCFVPAQHWRFILCILSLWIIFYYFFSKKNKKNPARVWFEPIQLIPCFGWNTQHLHKGAFFSSSHNKSFHVLEYVEWASVDGRLLVNKWFDQKDGDWCPLVNS